MTSVAASWCSSMAGVCRSAMRSWARRRIAQASIARDGGTTVVSGDIGEALDDMLFAGGKLNIKLLGGAKEMVGG